MSSLKELLSQNGILVVPGSYDAFTARLIESSGFNAVYLSGAGVSYTTLGQPDTGLITQTQMAARIRTIANAISIPLIADGDTGYGNAINVFQTVQLFEQAGAVAIQLEDQQFPKRCGHLSGKELVTPEEMTAKIRAAIDARKSNDFLIIARTDALTNLGIEEAIRRGKIYAEAGADVLFIESPMSAEDLDAIAQAFPNIPLMANMVEGGKTPLLTAEELQTLGYKLVIYPNSLTRRFAYAGLELLSELKSSGTTRQVLNEMMPFQELNQLLGIESLQEMERAYLPSPAIQAE